MDLGLFAAFAGGVLTLLSPCSIMLLPAFFSYAFSSPAALLARTGVFYLGLITTLVPMGVLAGSVGAFVSQYRLVLVTIVAVVVILLGLVLALGLPVPALARARGMETTSVASVYALGTVYGLAGVCAGPLLGAVLSMAALGGDPLVGGLTLLVFAAGMAAPLLLLALVWQRLPFVRSLVRPRELVIGRWRNAWTNVIGGAVTIAVGVLLLLTQGTTSFGGVLDVDTQFRIETWVRTEDSGVLDAVLVAVAVLVLLGLVLAGAVRRRRERATAESTTAARPE